MKNVYHPKAWVVLRAAIDGEQLTATVLPSSVSWTKNTYLRADTLDLSFDYEQAPLDPRITKGAKIALYFRDLQGDSIPFSEDGDVEFIGSVDTWAVSLNSSGGKITIKARDNTSFFLDKKVKIGVTSTGKVAPLPFNIDRSLYSIIEEIIHLVNGSEDSTELLPEGPITNILRDFYNRYGESLEFSTDTRENDILDKNPAELRGYPQDHEGYGTILPDSGESYWSLLSRICQIYAVIPYIDRKGNLRVTESTRAGRNVYGFTYGDNLESLTYTRDFKGMAKRRVVLRCYNRFATTREGRTIEGVFPETRIEEQQADGTPLSKPSSSRVRKGKTPKTIAKKVEDRILYLSGNYSKAQLDAAAELIFKKRAEENLKGAFETRDLYDSGLSAAAMRIAARFTPERDLDFDAFETVSNDLNQGQPVWKAGNGDVLMFNLGTASWRGLWPSENAIRGRLYALGMQDEEVDKATRLLLQADATLRDEDEFIRIYSISEVRHTFSQSSGYRMHAKFVSAIGEFK